MWDTEYKRRRPAEVAPPKPKKLEIEIPDARAAMSAVDRALASEEPARPAARFAGDESKKIAPGPIKSWTTEQVKARLLWLQENEPFNLLKFIVTRCGCFLEGDDE